MNQKLAFGLLAFILLALALCGYLSSGAKLFGW